MKKIISVLLSSGILLVAGAALAAALPPPPPPPPPGSGPTDMEQCKKGGWQNYGDMFKNQGDCVSFVATNGKNPPDGPAKNP